MSDERIERGAAVIITTADGEEIRTTALTGVESVGHSFPIVSVWRPLANGGSDIVPWPAEAVRLAPPEVTP